MHASSTGQAWWPSMRCPFVCWTQIEIFVTFKLNRNPFVAEMTLYFSHVKSNLLFARLFASCATGRISVCVFSAVYDRRNIFFPLSIIYYAHKQPFIRSTNFPTRRADQCCPFKSLGTANGAQMGKNCNDRKTNTLLNLIEFPFADAVHSDKRERQDVVVGTADGGPASRLRPNVCSQSILSFS